MSSLTKLKAQTELTDLSKSLKTAVASASDSVNSAYSRYFGVSFFPVSSLYSMGASVLLTMNSVKADYETEPNSRQSQKALEELKRKVRTIILTGTDDSNLQGN